MGSFFSVSNWDNKDESKKEPSAEEKKNDEPSAEEKKNGEPSTEEKKNGEPLAEEKKNGEPSAEEKKNSEPSAEGKKNGEPSAEEKKNGEPSAEEKKNGEPVAESKNLKSSDTSKNTGSVVTATPKTVEISLDNVKPISKNAKTNTKTNLTLKHGGGKKTRVTRKRNSRR